jgi:diacylglycerol kinase (CTP)
MRESEVQGYNGVIWYLAGTWAVLRFLPKDLGVMGVLLLSWCDPAASTFGRLWGRRTWRLRRGKSVAGSAAALVVGVLTAWGFWGFLVPRYDTTNRSAYAFQGVLKLSNVARETLGWHDSKTVVEGPLALGILSLVAGAVASASEAIDLFNWDDNFTIPVLCGIGLWGFLKVFGNA